MKRTSGPVVGIAHPTVVPANIEEDPRWRERTNRPSRELADV